MDDIDRQIVAALRADGRSTYSELGRTVGLSAASVHDRVRRLEESGTIIGYAATVSPAALGLGVCALISIHQTDSAERGEVVESLRDIVAIEDCWSVAGDEAFVVKVRVPDMEHLEHVLAELSHIPGVARTRTTVVLTTKWDGRPAGIGALPAPT
jgi:Lrp/AsnC family leucine-responsive transcriptional regulator